MGVGLGPLQVNECTEQPFWGGRAHMHCCRRVSALSDCLSHHPQILQQQHAPLLSLLGKQSGREVDKLAALQERGCALAEEWGLPVLEGECPSG